VAAERRWLAAACLLFAGLAWQRLGWLAGNTGGIWGWDYRIYAAAWEKAAAGGNPYLPLTIGTGFLSHPFLLVLVAPFAGLGEAGYGLWALLGAAAWLGTLWLCGRLVEVHGWRLVPLIFFTPAVEAVFMGQASALAGLAVVFAFQSGAALAMAIALKTSPLALAGYFVAKGRSRFLGMTALTLGLVTVLPMAVLYPELVADFWGALTQLDGLVHHSPQNASLIGLTGWAGMRWVGAAGYAGLVWLAYRRGGPSVRLYSAFLAWSILFSPLAWHHHFVLLALPLAALLAQDWKLGLCAAALFQWDGLFQQAVFPAALPALLGAGLVLAWGLGRPADILLTHDTIR